jgi:hypothetical protein
VPVGFGHLRSLGASPVDVQQLLNSEMLKVLKRLARSEEHSSGSCSDDGGAKDKRDFDGVLRGRRRLRRQPRRIVNHYMDRVRRELGVTHASQHWELRDHFNKMMHLFGRAKGFRRRHHAVADSSRHSCRWG